MHDSFFALRAALGVLAIGALCGTTPAMAAPRHGETHLVYDGVPEPTDDASLLESFLDAREARLLGWSPRGELLIATRFGETEQLHLVEQPLGARRQLTFDAAPIREGAFCPDPNRATYAYLRDPEGAGRAQLYLARRGASAAQRLTDGQSANGAPLWSNSGRALAFWSTARDGRSHDIEVVEPDTGVPRLVLAGDEASWIPLDWSPDDSKLLVLRRASAGDSTLYVVEVEGGRKREVEPATHAGPTGDSAPAADHARTGHHRFRHGPAGHPETAEPAGSHGSVLDARFARDGQGVYLLSDRDDEYQRLRYVSLFSSEHAVLSPALGGDVEALAISRDGHYLAYASNQGGYSRLEAIDLRAHQDLALPKPPMPGVIGHLAFDRQGRRLAFDLSAPAHPRDVYVLDLEARRLEPWTASEAGAIDTQAPLEPKLVEFPTFDRVGPRPRLLPAWVYEPATPGPHPVLVLLHGGPAAEFRPQFDPWISYLVEALHFAVVAPNVRGSSGYGRSFRALDDGTLRADVIKDLGALLVWIGAQDRFDARHVVVAGRDYGGTLALSALVDYGDRLLGAVDLAGITDLPGFLGGDGGRDPERAELGDERDPDTRAFLRRLSPLSNADRINRPVLVVHGRNDRRVPIAESEQLVARLRSRGQSVWYVEATRAGGELERQSERIDCDEVFAQFLEWLRP